MEDHEESQKFAETPIDNLVKKVLPTFIVELLKVYGYACLGDLTEFEECDVDDLENFVTTGKLANRVHLSNPETKQKYLGASHVEPANFSLLPMEKKKMKRLKKMAKEEMIRLAAVETKKRNSLLNDLKFKAKQLLKQPIEDGREGEDVAVYTEKIADVISKDNPSSSDFVDLQRGVLIARVIETANHFWSLINSNLKVDESMITLEQDLETGDVESGDIRCLMCSRYTKLNITKKKNTRDCTNYISLSNYKIHVMKTHLTLDQKTVLKEQLKSCLELERRQEIKTLALNQKPNSPNVEPKQEHLEISRIEPESSSFGSIQFIKMEFDAEETTEELSSLATRQKPSLVKKNKSKCHKLIIKNGKELEHQQNAIIKRIIEEANEMWSMTDCKMKINENMIAVQHDSRTGNIESGLIICFLCSRSFKLNIIRKKNAKKDFAHYVTLSNYRQHILKIHTSRQNVKISKD